jgi:arylsulfatase A-like enzyme
MWRIALRSLQEARFRTRAVQAGLLLLACVTTLAGCDRAPKALCEGCNVVLVTIDALRYDHLGTYGHARDTSPRMDELAVESVVFEHGVVAWPKTVPGLASILTGTYGRTNRMMYATFDPMRQESTLLSEMLKQNGSRTGAYVTNGTLSIERGWNQGFDAYEELWKDEKQRDQPRNVAEKG